MEMSDFQLFWPILSNFCKTYIREASVIRLETNIAQIIQNQPPSSLGYLHACPFGNMILAMTPISR